MSESIIGDDVWNQMTEEEKTEVVGKGSATLRQLTEGLLDGSDKLRDACRNFLVHTGTALEELPVKITSTPNDSSRQSSSSRAPEISKSLKTRRGRSKAKPSRQRFGLPEGFVSRLQRNGRTVLLEDNVYSLPNGDEFIPCHPTGTLGSTRHLYALLTPAQLNQGERGSVYIRTDGRIFNYSVDLANPELEMFDTGYTIHDLERTGRYGTTIGSTKTRRVSKRKATSNSAKAAKV